MGPTSSPKGNIFCGHPIYHSPLLLLHPEWFNLNFAAFVHASMSTLWEAVVRGLSLIELSRRFTATPLLLVSCPVGHNPAVEEKTKKTHR